MAFTGMHLTDSGAAAQAKTTANKPLHFTRVVLGDGVLAATASLVARKAVIAEKMSIPIEDIRVSGNIASVIVRVSNSALEEGFYFREMALCCIHPDTQEEIAYSYDNCREEGEYIGDKNSAAKVDFYLRLETAFTSTEMTQFPENPNPVYILVEEFEERLQDVIGALNFDAAGSAKAVQENLNTHANNANIHVTTEDKEKWDNVDLSGYVPNSRTINDKKLTENIELAAADVGAAASSHKHEADDISGILTVANGGTGLGTLTSGYPLFGAGTGAITPTAPATARLALGAGGYGTCSTAAATAAKVGTLSSFVRFTGVVVGIKFTYANTATSPTLNVNGTGAAYIYDYSTSTYPASGAMLAGTHFFQFNGTQWVLLNPASAQIATGSYTGTGTHGSSNPNSLTFPFTPKIVFLFSPSVIRGDLFYGVTRGFVIDYSSGSSYVYPTWSSSSVSWYHPSYPLYQLNYSGYVYTWVAIG